MGANLQELSLNLSESSHRIVHEMAMVSAIQEAQKDNLRSFNDYMMTVLEILYADGDEEKLIRSSLNVAFDVEILGCQAGLMVGIEGGVTVSPKLGSGGCIQYKTAIPYGLNLGYIVLSFAVYCCFEFAARLLLFYSAEQMLHCSTLLLIRYAALCTVMLSTVLMPSQSSQSEDIYLSVLSGATYGSAMVRRASKAGVGERKDWVTDALNATRAATEEGITRNATGLVALAIVAGLGALTHTLGTLVPVIGANGFAIAAAATAIGTVVGSFR
ncbi:hypothetical protein TEA_024928 [Camellia sinensis var. sinensis]|uniref:Uncharacterized protein n=1 Tax=Camellia sinensis var. sinensis TaxID=542762 RepID=A0A4S4F2X7_CAMSN|nr:hypothetical protein TEA_024928 [Camellia sinensis var. sinensis]